jgi:hypothetical protein
VAAGFAPASQAIKDFLKQLRNTPGEIEQLNSIQAKYKAIPKQALPSKLDTIKTDGKSALEPIYDTETDAAVEFGGKLKDILTSGMADAAKVLAEGLGNVLSGTQSAGDALKSVFSGLIGIVGTFISKLGELLIAQATASLAFAALAAVGPLAAPAALAAGIAAIAIGSAVSSLSKSGPYAGGGGATASVSAPRGGSSFAPAGSAGSAQSPLTIRVEVVGTLRGAGKDLVAVLTAADYRRLRTA